MGDKGEGTCLVPRQPALFEGHLEGVIGKGGAGSSKKLGKVQVIILRGFSTRERDH